MTIRLLLLWLFITTLLPASASNRSRFRLTHCYNFTRLNINAGAGMSFYNRTITEGGVLHRYISSPSTSFGAAFYASLWRTGGLGLGAARTSFSFEHQAEGAFASSNQFGVINTKYDLNYLSVPVSLYFQPACRSVLRFSYTPSFLSRQKYHSLLYGGAAAQDAVPLLLRDDIRKVQHSVSFYIASVFRISRGAFWTLEPYISYSFGPIEDTGTRGDFKPVTAGLAANIDLNVSNIDITINIPPLQEWREERKEQKRIKAEELRKRKEEAERKAREHIEQMKNQK